MTSETLKQHNFMAMSQSVRGRKRLRSLGRKPAPLRVASEFLAADTKAGKYLNGRGIVAKYRSFE